MTRLSCPPQLTGVLEDNNFLNASGQLQSQVTLFNWFSIRNTVESNRLAWEADKQQIEKAQNDIALNVAVAYLQILLSREQTNIARVQIEHRYVRMYVGLEEASYLVADLEQALGKI